MQLLPSQEQIDVGKLSHMSSMRYIKTKEQINNFSKMQIRRMKMQQGTQMTQEEQKGAIKESTMLVRGTTVPKSIK